MKTDKWTAERSQVSMKQHAELWIQHLSQSRESQQGSAVMKKCHNKVQIPTLKSRLLASRSEKSYDLRILDFQKLFYTNTCSLSNLNMSTSETSGGKNVCWKEASLYNLWPAAYLLTTEHLLSTSQSLPTSNSMRHKKTRSIITVNNHSNSAGTIICSNSTCGLQRIYSA